MATKTQRGVHLWDVIGVNLKTKVVRVMDRGLTKGNAEAYVMMAVMRRGVETEFFKKVPADRYEDGDAYTG